MSVTVPKDRGVGRAAAPAGDRFLNPSAGFYTWFNMLPLEFGSILHSGLPRHSHFESNCWPGLAPEKKWCWKYTLQAFLSGGDKCKWQRKFQDLSAGSQILNTKQETNAAFFRQYWNPFQLLIRTGRTGNLSSVVHSVTFLCWCCVLGFQVGAVHISNPCGTIVACLKCKPWRTERWCVTYILYSAHL